MRMRRVMVLFGVAAALVTGMAPAIAADAPRPDGIVTSDDMPEAALHAVAPETGPVPDTPAEIIGTDDRIPLRGTRTFPFRATTLISFGDGMGSSFQCTGFLVSADTVATAGHCVAPGGTSTFYPPSTYRISAGADGANRPYGTCRVVSLTVSGAWFTSGVTTADYGAIKLNCQVGNTTGWFGITGVESALGTTVYTDGYPGDKGQTHWFSQGRVTDSTPALLFYDNDTIGGQSGSPVWRNVGRCGICAVAIHTTGSQLPPFNHGTRITAPVAALLQFVIAS